MTQIETLQGANEFENRALPLIARNIPVVPLRDRSKIAFIDRWQDNTSKDAAKIHEWGQLYPNANVASVALPELGGIWVFEIDRKDVAEKIQQQTGQVFPNTFIVRSVKGAHFYFKQTPSSIAMGNLQAKDADGEVWSARVNRRYVVGPLSIHPDGPLYTVHDSAAIVEAPQWLIDWCIANSTESTKSVSGNTGSIVIREGGRNQYLTSKLGEARQAFGMDADKLYELGRELNERDCSPALPDSEVRTIANSVARYEVKLSGIGTVLLAGHVVGTQSEPVQIEPAKITSFQYPVFPNWVWGGIDAYDRWVKPYCEVNTRYPEFMMMPLMTVVLNYLALKVTVGLKGIIPSIYLLMVGRKGRVIKSSSAQDSIDFCTLMGIVGSGGPVTRTADAKSLVYTVGSTEGLGLEMTRANCKNAILFYDELSLLTNKMGIENSSFANHLSIAYESMKFANSVKSRKEGFNFDAKTYCISLIACTTDKRYQRVASKLFSTVDGLDERFYVLYQPEVLRDVKPLVGMPIPSDVVAKTRALIDKAIKQQVYRIDDMEPLDPMSKLGNRIEIRAEKFALGFAVLLGKDSIDESCVERGIALAKYEHQVKQYLQVSESLTREGGLQHELRVTLERAGGKMKLREFQRAVNYNRYDTILWQRVYGGLLKSGILAETGTGKGGRFGADPKMVVVLEPLLLDGDGDE